MFGAKLLSLFFLASSALTPNFQDTKNSSVSQCERLFEELDRKKDALTVKEFDQTMDGGWRILENERCFLEGAQLIQNYMKTKGNTDQNLYFHAGQLYAMAGDYTNAIAMMRKSLYDASVKIKGFSWNDYVLGVIAFLKSDKDDLLKQRDILQAQGGMNLNNVAVLNKLIENFHLTYSSALTDEKK